MKSKKIIIFYSLILAIILSQVDCFAQDSKSGFIMPETSRDNPKYTIEKIKKDITLLSKYIGTYPPAVVLKDDKQKVYDRWSDALIDANAHLKNEGATEEILSVLSELFREGHNLDVQGAGTLAKETIGLCLSKYEASLNCNFSAMRFYLSVESAKDNLEKAKKSVDFLTITYRPDVPSEVLDATAYLNSHLTKRDTVVKKEIKITPRVTKSSAVNKLTKKKKIQVSKKAKSRK